MNLCERLREEPAFAAVKQRYDCRDVQLVYEFARECRPEDSNQLAHLLLSRLAAKRVEFADTVGRLLDDATAWLNTLVIRIIIIIINCIEYNKKNKIKCIPRVSVDHVIHEGRRE